MTDLKLDEIYVFIRPTSEMPSWLGKCFSKNTIEVRSQRCIVEMVKTIAHELRHAYQFKNDITLSEYDSYKYESIIVKKIFGPNCESIII